MAKREEIENKTEVLIMPLIEANGLDLYDIDYVKEGGTFYLRIYLDKEGGITVNDCELVSREFNEILDREDYIDDSYIFEVSSPGLGRALKKDKHFARSLGEEVEVRLFKALNKKKEYIGILKAFDAQTITVSCETKDGVEDIVFERSAIALVRLTFDF